MTSYYKIKYKGLIYSKYRCRSIFRNSKNSIESQNMEISKVLEVSLCITNKILTGCDT